MGNGSNKLEINDRHAKISQQTNIQKEMMESYCRQIIKNISHISKITGYGHILTCFSIVEMFYAIYSSIKHGPKNPNWDERDIFIKSKGRAALANYCTVAHFGYFDIKEV